MPAVCRAAALALISVQHYCAFEGLVSIRLLCILHAVWPKLHGATWQHLCVNAERHGYLLVILMQMQMHVLVTLASPCMHLSNPVLYRA